MTLRDMTKAVVGQAAALSPQCRYDRAIFILAHMRCGSTALSNILCSRPDVSGYGEAHVRYDDESALGRLVVNQALRRAWKPGARHLFDKILHNRHDAAAPKAFFAARAIFVVREPGAAIRSIRKLYADLGRDEYGTDVEATEYYVERLQAMARMWGHFSEERRVGVSHSALLAEPEAELARLSTSLALLPALENRYTSFAASRKGGGGDPFASGRHTRIERRSGAAAPDPIDRLDIPEALRHAAQDAHDTMVGLMSA